MPSETYISILRGINVSGQKKIPMAVLKNIYEELHFENVTTYIQSGNVVFKLSQNHSPEDLVQSIEKSIEKKFHFQVPVIIRTISEMKRIAENNPFLMEEDVDLEKLYVTFLREVPENQTMKLLQQLNFSPDRFKLIGKEIYLYTPGGYGVTKLSNTFFEKKLMQIATTRNWKTVNKLVEIANEIKK